MARRRKRVEKINIDDKVRGNKLTAEEFNEVKNTVNELIDTHDDDLDDVEQSIETVQLSIDDLLSQSSQLLSYVNDNKNGIDDLNDLLRETAYMLDVHERRIITDEDLLNASVRLVNNHEMRITTVEDLLASSYNLLDGIDASDIPTTNSNVQQDIDELLLSSQTLLSYFNTEKEDIRQYVDDSYNRLYRYVEDTTLTFDEV
jgi:septal ring factor EnvC (AmiA/AmiB activator)